MGASAAQIAQAKQLAASRGYDPNLVDADNADRANTAFPVQAQAKPANTPATKTVAIPATAAGAPSAPAGAGGGSASSTPAATSPSDAGSLSGLYSAGGITPPAGGDAGATSATGGIGAAGATGGVDLSSLMQGGGQPGTPGQLRTGLGLRQPPQDSMALAGLRRIY